MLKQDRGRLVLVALFEHPGPLDRNIIVRKHVELLGSWGSTAADLRFSVELIASGRVDRKPLVSHRFGLDQAAEAFEVQEKGQAIKVVVTP
jgi:threonine dehydrogenase-like Zn-dependent dehydrogenase